MTEQLPFAQMYEEMAARPPGKFRPCARYNEAGDALEIYLDPAPHVVERVDSLFSIFVDAADRNHIVGLAIKDIGKNFEGDDLKRVLFSAGRARASLLLLGARFQLEAQLERKPHASMPALVPKNRIKEILGRIEDAEVEIEVPAGFPGWAGRRDGNLYSGEGGKG